MGAHSFVTVAKGESAQDAFNQAVSDAQYENGHGGYTGTIAEKSEFRMVTVPHGVDPLKYAEQSIFDHPLSRDKWGPAGCVDLGDGRFAFFGTAPS